MKNQVLCAIAGMVTMFFVNGCVKPVVEPPALTLETTEFTAAAEGGTVSVPFELKNATEGAVVSVKPVEDYEWAEVSSVGKASIELSIAENTTTEARTAEFSVSYPGISTDKKFKVTQAAGTAVAPVLTLASESVDVAAEGVTDATVGYSVENPVADGTVSVKVPDGTDWLTVAVADDAENIVYSVAANDTEEARTAVVTVSYTGAADVNFTVNQAAGEPAPEEASFEISVSNITAESFTYSIVPSDKEMTYFHLYMAVSDLEELGVIADGVFDQEALYQICKMYYMSDPDYFEMLTAKGDLKDAYGAGLSAEVMRVFCFGVDPETLDRLSDVFYTDFKMEALPATIDLDESEFNVGAGGYNGGTYYYTGGDFGEGEVTAVSDKDWVTVSVDEGEKYIAFTVAANDTPEVRTATVTVSHPSVAEPAVLTINQEAGKVEPFVVELTDLTPNSFSVSVVPTDKEMSYFVSAVSQAYIDENGLTSDEAIYQDDYSYYGTEMQDMLEKGDKTFPYVGVKPNTAMVFYVYGVDPTTLERLTDVVYAKFTTPEPEMIDASFLFDVKVDGVSAAIGVDPQGYEGYWFPLVLETASVGPEETLYDKCSEQFSMYVSMYQYFGLSNEEILSMLCKKGPDSIVGDLDPLTEYTIAVVAVSDDLMVNSEASSATFTTGEASGTTSVQQYVPAGSRPFSAEEMSRFAGTLRTIRR